MENKEKLNQNPEVAEKQTQEENPAVSNETDQVTSDQSNVKAEEAQGDKKEDAAVEAAVAEEVVTKAEEPVAEKVEEPVAEKVEEPVVEKVEEPIAAKVEEPVAEKVEEPAVEKVEEPVAAKVEEPVAEKVEEPVAEKVEEPVAAKVEEPAVEKVEEPASEKVEEPAVEKVEEPVAEKVEEPAVEKVEEPVAEKTEEPVSDQQTEEASKDDSSDKDDSDEGDEDEEEEVVTEETYANHSIEELIAEFEAIVESEKIVKAKNKVSFIRLFFGKKMSAIKQEAENLFVEAGGKKEEYKPEPNMLDEKFNRAFGKYKSLRRKYRAEQEKQKIENLQKKNDLLEEMRGLINSDESLKTTYDKFTEIQARWRDAGMVPQADLQILWNNYHFLVEKFFDKVKINKELRDLDLKKNLEAKILLCEKAEGLLIEESINKSFKLLQEYHNEWKGIGPVPTSSNEEIWERFKATSDKINERRKEHYEELQGKLEENYQAKQALVVKAEELVLKPVDTTKEWGKRTEEFEELLKVWKTFGPAPRKYNDSVWADFKGHFNNFYDAKKEYFGKLKEGQQDNYHRKLDLLKQSQVLKDNTDWNTTTKSLINLQKEWKKVGPVPRKHSDEIWKQFRAANDAFFAAKANHFKGQFEEEDQNLVKKKTLIEEIKSAKSSEDKKENLEMIKTFQRQWSEIGNVPRKEMDRLYKAYRAAVDEQLDKLDISKVDFRNAGFRDRIDGFKKSDDGSGLRKERFSIQKSMEKLKEDVLLWENNMGFFRNSKNADVLKLEFEKKIQKTKAEILLLKEKLKMIDK